MEGSEPAINWMAQIAAVVAMQIVGFVWYNPKVLGDIWMRESGVKMGEGRPLGMLLGITSVLALLASFIVAYLVKHGGPEFATFKHGAFHGAMLGVMVGLPIIATSALYENRSWTYIGISAGYWIVGLAVMGGILCAWQ